jgi:hypothetical protein
MNVTHARIKAKTIVAKQKSKAISRPTTKAKVNYSLEAAGAGFATESVL